MTTETPVVQKRAYKKRSTRKTKTGTSKIKSTIAPQRTSAIPTKTTVITIAPDGIITITKREETVTDLLGVEQPRQVMTKVE